MGSEGKGHKILLSSDELSKRITELGSSISKYYQHEAVTVLALTNGAIIFAADLVRQLTCPVRLDTFAVSSYNERKRSGKSNIRTLPKLNVAGRHVLVVDDILDTGLTLREVRSWLEKQNAKSVKICVLLEKQLPKREVDISADWAGFKVPNVFIYGYGLDRDEFERNLPFIAEVVD